MVRISKNLWLIFFWNGILSSWLPSLSFHKEQWHVLPSVSGTFCAALLLLLFLPRAPLLFAGLAKWHSRKRRSFSLSVGAVCNWEPGTLSAQTAVSPCSPHHTSRLPYALHCEYLTCAHTHTHITHTIASKLPVFPHLCNIPLHSPWFVLQGSYVYVFDGLPRFLGNGVVHSDHNLIGAFCGTSRTQPITVEATSGIPSYLKVTFIAPAYLPNLTLATCSVKVTIGI